MPIDKFVDIFRYCRAKDFRIIQNNSIIYSNYLKNIKNNKNVMIENNSKFLVVAQSKKFK